MAISTGAALLGSAVIGAGSSLLGGSAKKKAANQAANISLQVQRENNALAKDIYGQNKGALTPYMNLGTNAGNMLGAEVAGGPKYGPAISSTFLNSALNPGSFDDFRESTGYNFRLNEGLGALQTGYAARGALQSGAAMKDIVRFGQDFASNEYGRYIGQLDNYARYADAFAGAERAYRDDRYDNWLGLLANQQAVGLSGASALAGVGQNYVNTVSANNNSAGTARANAALVKGAANAGALAGVGNAVGGALGYFVNPMSYGYG